MGHISYDAHQRIQVGTALKLKIERSKDQFRVATFWTRGVDTREYGCSEGRQLLSFRLSWAAWRKPRSFVASIQWGMGAGYIGGWTMFFGRRCKGGRVNYVKYPLAAHKAASFRFGITRNGNAVPYPNW